MKLVIIHYHLRVGGVTRVIERQLEAIHLSDPLVDVILLSGSEPTFPLPENVRLIVNPILEYYSLQGKSESEIRKRYDQIKALLLGFRSDTIFHVHNPTLGKSVPFTIALRDIAQSGRKVLYHCHDFPDERPAMMSEFDTYCRFQNCTFEDLELYPMSGNVLFLVANKKDKDRFPQGLQPKVFYLINPVVFKTNSMYTKDGVASILALDSKKVWVVYPVRAITRKNIGEVLLLSILFGDAYEWLVTLAPQNSAEISLYEKWVSLAEEFSLPVHFNVAEKVALEKLMPLCDFVVTTSYKEGFGLAYLEPWLVHKPVVGRRIEQVVSDFEECGMQFSSLYTQLLVPYNDEDEIDFALLTPKQQEEFLLRIVNERPLIEHLKEVNPYLDTLFAPVDESVFISNCNVVVRYFSLDTYADVLHFLYKKML